MTRVREMQVDVGNCRLLGRRDPDRERSECRPVLPSEVGQQTPLGQDFVKTAQHYLLRLGHGKIHFHSTDSPANATEKRTETRDVWAKAELVVFGRLIGESYAKLRKRP